MTYQPRTHQWSVRLPTSFSKLQFALAGVDAQRLSSIDPEIILTLWNPWTCPIELLPYLAWALSVDVWQNDWPEQVKRETVAAAPFVHRIKGTVAAIERAVEPFRATLRIEEWFESDPPKRRGTFEVTAFVGSHVYGDGPFLNDRIQNDIIQTIKATKPKSRVFSLKLGAGFKTALGVANAVRTPSISCPTMQTRLPSLGTRLGMALLGRSTSFLSIYGEATE